MSLLRLLLTALPYWVFAGISAAQPPPGYYDPAAGLTGQALKQALHDIIDDHTVLSNNDLWTAFYTTDDRSDGHVWDIYSDIPGGSAPYLYTFGADQCGTYNSEGDCYNREHSFPLSWFNDQPPMDTDLHHIYPTDGWVNQKRGNLPYGEVGPADFTSMNGTLVGDCVTPGYTGSVMVCEPIDGFKGDLARTYFYMMTRYAPEASSWTSEMLQSGDLSAWAEALLLQWHTDDPVSAKETDRNNAAFVAQDNRNPYIDHPEWVESIWGPFATMNEVTAGSPRVWIIDGVLEIAGVDGILDLVITDAMGREALHEHTDGRSIDVSMLPTGAYTVSLISKTWRVSVRFVL